MEYIRINSRYYVYTEETSSWWRISKEAIEAWPEYQQNEDPAIANDAYSHWCADYPGKEMPSGWSP